MPNLCMGVRRLSYYHVGGFWWNRLSRPKKVWLESTFRVFVIKKGIERAGSINRLGRELGYRSRVHPGWNIRQILLGYRPLSYERLAMLANYIEYPVSELLRHQVQKELITVKSTEVALRQNDFWIYLLR